MMMPRHNQIEVLEDKLAKQQEENRFLASELEALRATVLRLAAAHENIKAGEPKYVAPKLACEGTSLDADTIRKWCAQGQIDCRRLGGRWYVDLAGTRTQTRLALYRPKMEGFLK
jgi:hypothetical protein